MPKNHVIDQDPEAGATIKRGRDVKIRVSRGPETIIMPNLAGLSLQQSRILLAENGLCQGLSATMRSSRYSAGQVIAQMPSPGDTVSRNTCADLLVNKGPAPSAFRMLDLSGLTLQTALRRLEQVHMVPGRIHIVHDSGASLETIVDQHPLAGYRVARGTPVDLTVNRMPNPTGTHKQAQAGQVELFRFALEHGFLNKRVQVKINQRQLSLSLFDDFLAPGQEIWLLIPKSGNPTVLVYVDGQLVKTQIMD
jgi:serine/threonine-protein kinase